MELQQQLANKSSMAPPWEQEHTDNASKSIDASPVNGKINLKSRGRMLNIFDGDPV